MLVARPGCHTGTGPVPLRPLAPGAAAAAISPVSSSVQLDVSTSGPMSTGEGLCPLSSSGDSGRSPSRALPAAACSSSIEVNLFSSSRMSVSMRRSRSRRVEIDELLTRGNGREYYGRLQISRVHPISRGQIGEHARGNGEALLVESDETDECPGHVLVRIACESEDQSLLRLRVAAAPVNGEAVSPHDGGYLIAIGP